MKNEQIKKQIINIAKRLHGRNMLAGCDGNISFRVSDDEIIITPSGVAKAFIEPEDFTIIDINSNTIQGNPSSERAMHLYVYQNCPKAKAIVHAHPPHAIAWSVAHPELTELPAKCLTELILCVGHVPIVPMAIPGTQDMGSVLKPYLPKHRVMILARHGALSWGEDLEEAINGMERIEHAAQILKTTKDMGGLSEISNDDFRRLEELRNQIGERNL